MRFFIPGTQYNLTSTHPYLNPPEFSSASMALAEVMKVFPGTSLVYASGKTRQHFSSLLLPHTKGCSPVPSSPGPQKQGAVPLLGGCYQAELWHCTTASTQEEIRHTHGYGHGKNTQHKPMIQTQNTEIPIHLSLPPLICLIAPSPP